MGLQDYRCVYTGRLENTSLVRLETVHDRFVTSFEILTGQPPFS